MMRGMEPGEGKGVPATLGGGPARGSDRASREEQCADELGSPSRDLQSVSPPSSSRASLHLTCCHIAPDLDL